MEWDEFTIGMGIILFPLIMVLLGFYIMDNAPYETRNIACYDRYGNVIEGLTCEQEYIYLGDSVGEKILAGFLETISEFAGIFVLILIPGIIIGSVIIVYSIQKRGGDDAV